MANLGRQGVYSPLPQSISDSDSEKELQMDSLHSNYSHHHTNNGIFKNHEQYIPSSNGCTLPNHVDVKMKPGFYNMSTIRKFNFISSIFLCFFTIFIFLWVLPCNEGTCPVKIVNWDRTHENIEMKGKINVVRNANNYKQNLAIIFKNDINSVDNSNGIISLMGNNGDVVWYISENEVPIHLNCYDLDANQDNVFDCLVVSERSLKLIEPLSGQIIWSNNLINTVDNPLLINDLNKDNIKDLIVVQKDNEVVIISGKTGVILVSFVLKHCKFVKSETFFDQNYLYLCHFKGKDRFYKITLLTLNKIFMNDQTKIDTTRVDYQRKNNVITLNDRKLIINNNGICPNCNVSIVLVDEKDNKQILNWSYGNTYIMSPKTFSFSTSKDNLSLLKGHVNGFILKLWQWTGYSKTVTKTRNERNIPPSNETINIITERIVLLTFNDTNFHIINASSNEISQLCQGLNNNCQPDLHNQNDSMLITDLNDDNSLELVSYSSTYKFRTDIRKWHLVSNIKLIRLEAELPKLYKTAK